MFEENVQITTTPKPDATTSIMPAQALESRTNIRINHAISSALRCGNRLPHPALTDANGALVSGAEYNSRPIHAKLEMAYIENNASGLNTLFPNEVKYINDVGVEYIQPKEGVRVTGGTERELIDFDGSMAPAP
jgi:hypothetical protein